MHSDLGVLMPIVVSYYCTGKKWKF